MVNEVGVETVILFKPCMFIEFFKSPNFLRRFSSKDYTDRNLNSLLSTSVHYLHHHQTGRQTQKPKPRMLFFPRAGSKSGKLGPDLLTSLAVGTWSKLFSRQGHISLRMEKGVPLCLTFGSIYVQVSNFPHKLLPEYCWNLSLTCMQGNNDCELAICGRKLCPSPKFVVYPFKVKPV